MLTAGPDPANYETVKGCQRWPPPPAAPGQDPPAWPPKGPGVSASAEGRGCYFPLCRFNQQRSCTHVPETHTDTGHAEDTQTQLVTQPATAKTLLPAAPITHQHPQPRPRPPQGLAQTDSHSCRHTHTLTGPPSTGTDPLPPGTPAQTPAL